MEQLVLGAFLLFAFFTGIGGYLSVALFGLHFIAKGLWGFRRSSKIPWLFALLPLLAALLAYDIFHGQTISNLYGTLSNTLALLFLLLVAPVAVHVGFKKQMKRKTGENQDASQVDHEMPEIQYDDSTLLQSELKLCSPLSNNLRGKIKLDANERIGINIKLMHATSDSERIFANRFIASNERIILESDSWINKAYTIAISIKYQEMKSLEVLDAHYLIGNSPSIRIKTIKGMTVSMIFFFPFNKEAYIKAIADYLHSAMKASSSLPMSQD
jgi:hypothetical protein